MNDAQVPISRILRIINFLIFIVQFKGLSC